MNYKNLAFFLVFVLFACQKETEVVKEITPAEKKTNDSLETVKLDSIDRATWYAQNDTFPKINYTKVVIEDRKVLKELKKEYRMRKDSNQKYKALITLNRKSLRHFRAGDTIIIPDRIVEDTRAYSVFPQSYYDAKDLKQLILVSTKWLAYACYEYGVQVRFAACNTGKERTPTFPGRYALVWKEKDHRSSLDSNWKMPYNWNFHPNAGNAFHQYTMPGRAVSHSCVRQFMDDAKWLYYWGSGVKRDTNRRRIPFSGTPVLVLDVNEYSRKVGPWVDLSNNSPVFEDLPEDVMSVDEALIPWCQIPVGSRWRYAKRPEFKHAEDTLRARGIIQSHVKLIETVNFNHKRRKKRALAARKKKREEVKKLKALELKKKLEMEELMKQTFIEEDDSSADTNQKSK